MDNSDSTHSILDTLRTVEFRLGLKGYNVDEVDEYLEKAAVEAEQVQERLRGATERLRHATDRIALLELELQGSPAGRGDLTLPAPTVAPAETLLGEPVVAPEPSRRDAPSPVSEDALQRTLLLAQKFVDQTKRESEAEAAQVVGQAEERARSLLAQAEERARQLTADAEERLRDEVSRLEAARTRLASDVESMSKHLEEQRVKIRTSLTDALRWVDERMQPGGNRSPQAGDSRTAARPAEHPAAQPTAKADDHRRDTTRPVVPSGSRESAPATPGPATAAAHPQPTGASPGAGGRQVPATVPAQPASERPTAPVGARLGVLNGGLFDSGRAEAKGFEEDRSGE